MVAPFKRKRWREAQRVRLDLNGVSTEIIGAAGVGIDDLHAVLPTVAALERTAGAPRGAFAFGRDAATLADLPGILGLANEVRARADDLVLLGAGEAVAGARVLVRALAGTVAPDPARPAERLRVHAVDAMDPDEFGALLGRLDLRRTLFDVVSISGENPETLGAFLIVRDRMLKELGAVEYKQHIVMTTGSRGALRQIVHDEGFRALTVEADTPGAAAILSTGALFPAACAGIDVAELLAGAAFIDALGASEPVERNPVVVLAAVLHLLRGRGALGEPVIRPSVGALAGVAGWFTAAWRDALAGERCARPSGAAVGGRDAAVPPANPRRLDADDLSVFVRVEAHARELAIPKSYDDLEAAAYLGGLGLGALIHHAEDAAETARARAGRPSLTVRAPRLNAFVVGELLVLLGAATALVGALARDGTVAPGAPASDEARQLTYGLAGRPGFEGMRAEAQRWLGRKDARWIV